MRYAGLSLSWPLPLRSTGSGRAGSAAMAHGPSRSAACGILPDRGTNPRPLHRQADSQPLRHQGSPLASFWIAYIFFLPAFIYLFILKNLFIYYLFLAVLGLHCCTPAFSSCGEQGLLFVAACSFSLLWLLLLQSTGSRRAGFSSCGSQALERRLSGCGARA